MISEHAASDIDSILTVKALPWPMGGCRWLVIEEDPHQKTVSAWTLEVTQPGGRILWRMPRVALALALVQGGPD